MKGYDLFVIDANGNDVSMINEVDSIANSMLPKISGFNGISG
jgi:hypothetical protein